MKKLEFDFHSKVALITGATGGIGNSMVENFGAAGAAVFISGRREDQLKKMSGLLTGNNIQNDFKAIGINIPGSCQVV